ncbi:hypothetical protein GCM10009546_08010 [Actinomadura livida]|nr:hypothetical protein GCM10010208_21540 [Actinomadura livida]
MIVGRDHRKGEFDISDSLLRVERTAAGPRALRRGFLALPDVVQQGRLIVESQVLQWGLAEETAEDAVLIASELLTNAVRATPHQPIALRMALAGDGLRVEVWDSSPERPRVSTPDLSMPEEAPADDAPDPGGWGMRIVASLAREHGVRTEFEGKSVWAVLKAERR